MVAFGKSLQIAFRFRPVWVGIVALLWAMLQTNSAFADKALGDEQLASGWEESQISAVKEAVRDFITNPANQNYNALSLQRSLVLGETMQDGKFVRDKTVHERFHRKCSLVRKIGNTTWIRYFHEYETQTGTTIQHRHVWIIDSHGILQIKRRSGSSKFSPASTRAIFQVGHEGHLSDILGILRAFEILPNKFKSFPLSLRRQNLRYRVDSNDVPRLQIEFPQTRVLPGNSKTIQSKRWGDVLILLSRETPNLPTLVRPYFQSKGKDAFQKGSGTKYFYDRSADNPVFPKRFVSKLIKTGMPTRTTSADTRFERAVFDSHEIPLIKIAKTDHRWSIRSDNKWMTITAEDVPQQFLDRVDVVSDEEADECYQKFPEQFLAIRDRLRNQDVASVEEVLGVEHNIAEAPPETLAAVTSNVADSGDRRSMFLSLGITMLLIGVILLAAFGASRLVSASHPSTQ